MTTDKTLTKEEFVKAWRYDLFFLNQTETMLSDLNALLREELIKYSAWGFGSDVNNKSIIEDVDEYLKSQQ
jgi:hypothetical protein